jgi:phosphopantetheinyl transferase
MLTHIGSSQEIARLSAGPVSNRASHSFLDLWTRKEACMKAVGTGLQWDPRSIEVGHVQQAVELDAWHQGRKRRLCVDSLDLGRYGLSASVAFLAAD